MQIKRRMLAAGTTFFLAAATGHLMQNGTAIGARFSGDSQASADQMTRTAVADRAPAADVTLIDEASVISLSADTTLPAGGTDHPALPELPGMTVQPLVGGAALAARMIKVEHGTVRVQSDADAAYDAFGLSCGTTVLNVEVAKPAMLMLDLAAPCHPNERVTVSHAGIALTMKTDAAGRLSAAIPAMTRDGAVSVQFMAGERAVAERAVPDIATVQRVALLAQGQSAFDLNVYENGARYGTAGHVRAAAARDATTADGGFLVLLGDISLDQPMVAQVYSAPAALMDRRIEVETKVTSDTCGTVRTAEAVWTNDGKVMTDTLSLTMPGCDAAGDLIVLDVTPFLAGPTRRAAAD